MAVRVTGLGPAFGGASQEVLLFSPYFVPGRQGADNLVRAAQSGLRTDYDPLNDCGCGCAIM